MKTELITVVLLLAKSMGAYADDQAPTRLSDIPREVQQCILIASHPDNRDLIKMVLDPDCVATLSDADQQKAQDVISSIHHTTTSGIPMLAK